MILEKFMVELDLGYDCKQDSDYEGFNLRRFHSDQREPIIEYDGDYNDDDEGLDLIRFYGVSEKHERVHDHCYCTGKFRGAEHNVCSLVYNKPNEVSVAFHNGSNYDYRFKSLKEKIEYLRENTEKCFTFSALIEKQIND